jgi:sialate O-acetylesterase
MPFYSVQLAGWQAMSKDPAGGDGWSEFRDAQRRSLAIPFTGMASAVDVGDIDDIHPKNKQDVGERLALLALARDYGQKNLVCSGPLYREMKVEGNKIRISFDSTGSGLIVATKKGYDPIVKDPQGKLKKFAIAGVDRIWGLI